MFCYFVIFKRLELILLFISQIGFLDLNVIKNLLSVCVAPDRLVFVYWYSTDAEHRSSTINTRHSERPFGGGIPCVFH